MFILWKSYWYLFCLYAFFFSSVYAYEATKSDEVLVTALTNAIEDLIQDQWEDYRNIYIDRLEDIRSYNINLDNDNQKRIIYVVDKVIYNLSILNLFQDIFNKVKNDECASFGEISNSSVWPMYYKPCCEWLVPYGIDPELDWAGAVCYPKDYDY